MTFRSWSIRSNIGKGKFGANAMKRVAAGAHLPTPPDTIRSNIGKNIKYVRKIVLHKMLLCINEEAPRRGIDYLNVFLPPDGFGRLLERSL